MAKMFDKVSHDFLSAIKGVMEAKKLDPVGKENDDIDNDGDVDKSDKYLHNRRKAIKSAMMKKEEAEQIDEISTKLAADYSDKASDARGHRKLSTPKLDKRYKSMALAHEKIRGRHAKVATTEEVEELDELSHDTLRSYRMKAKSIADHGGDQRTKGRELASRKSYGGRMGGIEKAKVMAKEEAALTPEEIEMIEAKMAGVAKGSMDDDKHMCATKVFHKEWAEGTPIKTMHADPDADGLIEWYDVMFDHGIERVMTEDMEILQAESHMHSKRKMKEEVEELEELSTKTLDSYRSKSRSQIIGARNKDTDTTEKRLKGYTKASQNIQKNFVKGIDEETEELDEARGRPKKAAAKDFTVHPVTKEKLMHNNPAHMKKIELLQKNKVIEKPKVEAAQHIMNQLQKAKTSMHGGSTIHFTHGESKHVSGSHAAKLITKYQGMKPSEKEDFQKKIGHSHEQLMKHV